MYAHEAIEEVREHLTKAYELATGIEDLAKQGVETYSPQSLRGDVLDVLHTIPQYPKKPAERAVEEIRSREAIAKTDREVDLEQRVSALETRLPEAIKAVVTAMYGEGVEARARAAEADEGPATPEQAEEARRVEQRMRENAAYLRGKSEGSIAMAKHIREQEAGETKEQS